MAATRAGVSATPIGWVGVALAVLAWFITLPPLMLRTPVPSILLAAAAVGAGVIAVQGGQRKLGYGAVVAGVLAAILAVVGTQSGEANLERVFVWSALIAAMLRFATPPGFAVNFLALGITGYVFIAHYGDQGTPGDVPRVPELSLPLIEDLDFFGTAIGSASVLTWVALLLVPLLALYLFRTAGGLRLRSVGEKPRAADSVGVPVLRTRYLAVIVSGLLAGLGGVYLSVGLVGSFNENMTDGRGFIALAAVIFGSWRPGGALAAALLFGFSSAVAQRLPAFSESLAVLFQALPYVLVLIVVAGLIGRSRPPAAIGVPYVKE